MGWKRIKVRKLPLRRRKRKMMEEEEGEGGSSLAFGNKWLLRWQSLKQRQLKQMRSVKNEGQKQNRRKVILLPLQKMLPLGLVKGDPKPEPRRTSRTQGLRLA